MPDEVMTIKQLLNQVATRYPDRRGFIEANNPDRSDLTFSEMNGRARRFANFLSDRGVTKGDRVAIISESIMEYAVAFFGITKLGAIPATIHRREGVDVISALIEELDADVLLFQSRFSDLVERLESDAGALECIALEERNDRPKFAESAAREARTYSDSEPDVAVSGSDRAFIIYTSGSTSEPNPVVHTHEAAIEYTHLSGIAWTITPGDVVLNTRTPSFVGWLKGLPFTNVGGTVVFVEEWTPESVLETIDEYDISFMTQNPTQWSKIVQANENGACDLSSLRMMLYTGNKITSDLFDRVREQINENLTTCYGGSETIGPCTLLPLDEVSVETRNSIGRENVQCDIRIVDPKRRDPAAEVDRGDTGEVIVRAPTVTSEIWNDPETTRELIHEDGWWLSGDIGYLDEDGFIYIEGRADNMIISGGINIYPEAVKDELEHHPGIDEVVVVGTTHEEWGETLKAYVRSNDESITKAGLKAWCKDNDSIANYQRPRFWAFVDEFPRTSTNKIDRSALEE